MNNMAGLRPSKVGWLAQSGLTECVHLKKRRTLQNIAKLPQDMTGHC